MQKIVIVGSGQNGRVVKGILSHNSGYQVIGFLDYKASGPDILGKVEDFHRFLDCFFFAATGNPKWRKEDYELLQAGGARFTNAIHPRAFIEDGVQIGENVMVGAMTYLNVGTKIGNNCIINNGCIVEHDCQIGDNCNINPGVVMGGGVVIGDNCFVGLGAKLRDHISIGSGTTIGMGTIVLKDVLANTTLYNRMERVEK